MSSPAAALGRYPHSHWYRGSRSGRGEHVDPVVAESVRSNGRMTAVDGSSLTARMRLRMPLTTMAYASIGQAAQILAEEAASLLPGHPKLASQRSLAHIGGLAPTARATLNAVPSGSVTLGPGRPHLVLFFATWLTETSGLRAQLTALGRYARIARHGTLQQLVAVDEVATEPSPGAAYSYLQRLGHLGYPVALDTTGRLADGYGVQDQPWFVLTSASGKIVWKHDGWLPATALKAAARRA